MTNHGGRLAAATNGQHGAFSIEQAIASGVPEHVLRGWITSGLLSSSGVRTYRAVTSPPSSEADLASLVVDIRPQLWFSFVTAFALAGLEGFSLTRPYHATLARGSYVKRPELVVHTSNETTADDTKVVRGFNIMSVERTIIDMTPHLSTRQLTVVIDGAIRDRLTTEVAILERIAAIRSQGRAAIPKLIAVMDGAEPSRGGHSWLERRFLELVAQSGLPRPITQQIVGKVDGRAIRVDCRFAGTPVVVELLGYRWHRTGEQMQRDTARMNRMLLDGLMPLQFTYDDIVTRPAVSIELLGDTLARFVSNI